MTPTEAVHRLCVECAGSPYQVRECGGDVLLSGGSCLFFPYRMGRGRVSVRTIRLFCLTCMGGDKQLVRQCVSTGCQVWNFRLGRNPNYVRNTP